MESGGVKTVFKSALMTGMRYIEPSPSPSVDVAFTPRERAILDKINRKVAGAASLTEVMEFLFEETQDLYPCDRIGLAFVEDEGRRIVSRWARARYAPLLLDAGYSEDLQGSSLRAVIERGTPRIIDDLPAYFIAHPASRSTRLLVDEGVRSSMTCPLAVDGRNVGVMFRSSREERAYTDRHMALHLAIAERLSQAVEKTYLIEQLRAANAAYTEMLGFVSHELKSPLASIVTDAELLTGGYLGAMTDEQETKVKRMAVKAQHLLGLIREYLDLARLEGGELTLHAESAVDVDADIVQPAIELVRPQMDEHKVQLVYQPPAQAVLAQCDLELLKIVIVNLLSNAVKYGVEGGKIALALALGGDGLTVSVRNEGPGFPASEENRLFRKFSRLQTPELRRRKGTGVGLYTCWRIVRLHGGVIRAKSNEGQWAEFWFTIPQPLPQPNEKASA